VKIARLDVRAADVPLTRPYAVASHATDAASMLLLRLVTEGRAVGLGAATPEPEVNGDTRDGAVAELLDIADAIAGRAVAELSAFSSLLAQLRSPGARMALDLALHDLWAQAVGKPLVDLLGRQHTALPTSVTIGLGDVAMTLREADEYTARGFTALKVKIGQDLGLDVERLVRLREHVGRGVTLRVDGNLGYQPQQLLQLLRATQALDLEFVEQPLPCDRIDAQRALPAAITAMLMADESLHGEDDARALAAPPRAFGSFNIKLVKCGGIRPARAIAAIARDHGLPVMWGCMDESRIAIAAALHAAYSCAATRWLDLDGHLDLAHDFATGGFTLERGVLRLGDGPGLGVVAAAGW
jgi:L-alanine-DL-glutamate epimerase-like enolase superfamily enzyme